VASGRIIFGAVGAESRLEYTCIGDPVNLSAKLEKHNSASGTRALVDAETYALALQQGYTPLLTHDRQNAAQVAGVDAPLDVVVLSR
jgi:adenylate cyclase